MTMRMCKKVKRCSMAIPFYSVAIIGAGFVGKSSMIERFIDETFTSEYEPTISEVYNVPLKRNGRIAADLLLYDTAGSIEFPVMRRLTVSKSHACMILYAVDSAKSLAHAEKYIEEVITVCPKGFPCVLVGTKNDVEKREVSFEMGLRLAVKYGCSYIETSAKSDVNITDVFDAVLKKIEYLKLHERYNSSELIEKPQKRFSAWSMERI